ncbi:EVE domain-containing protein [Anaplasmataceae bacterium AB001_6]|nr:EVE domain-containing protein [Anaplasmataceae bacterium AB001_6]
MSKWLIKADPKDYSWSDFVKDKYTLWDGVKNNQAIKNMKRMQLGEVAFFYHSHEKYIMGIAKVSKTHFIDNDETVVEFKCINSLNKPVSLALIKATDVLSDMQILRQSRLSVSEVTKGQWDKIISLSE